VTKPGFSFCVYFMLLYILLLMSVCFCCVRFFQYLAKRLAGKNAAEVTYFVSVGT